MRRGELKGMHDIPCAGFLIANEITEEHYRRIDICSDILNDQIALRFTLKIDRRK